MNCPFSDKITSLTNKVLRLQLFNAKRLLLDRFSWYYNYYTALQCELVFICNSLKSSLFLASSTLQEMRDWRRHLLFSHSRNLRILNSYFFTFTKALFNPPIFLTFCAFILLFIPIKTPTIYLKFKHVHPHNCTN